jgi:Holliday junction resolvase RusA-like endonuclease
MIIEAFIDCHPPTRTAQQKGARILKTARKKPVIRFFTKAEVKAAEEYLMQHFRRTVPPAPMHGPLKLTVTWSWNWFQYELPKRKAGELPVWVPSILDPDFDNISKLFCDVLTKLGYWQDDAHVSCAMIRKGRGDRPGIHLRLEPYDKAEWYTPPEGAPVAEVEL